MVQFTKLRLSGFKSFVDSTELVIDTGLTGIVGPNGCGKSNLVEALRWVMGETSAKRMRGGEMDDVIFSGNSGRPARNVAEVEVVLENADRKVPAMFNEFEQLEIRRRIDRGAGSSYEVNGKEARARDVQLLFADASTGAHSTALVSQGRIGALINAKPTDRRGLLEEAAGITGLHSRRHEAELRLRAAEANLARLDDVIITLESQLQALKKQARQAVRYRNIADQLRRAEAVLLHLLWLETVARAEQADAAFAAAEAAVIETTASAAAEATRQAEAASALPPLRQREVEAAAQLQRLTIAQASLEEEEKRVIAASAEAERRRGQTEADIAREQTLAADAKTAVGLLGEERSEIESTEGDAAALVEEAARALAAAEAIAAETEAELLNLGQAVAAGEARESALARRAEELAQRLARLNQRRAEISAEREPVEAALKDDGARLTAEAALTAAEEARQEAETKAEEADIDRNRASQATHARREPMDQARSRRDKLGAEASALGELIAAHGSGLWPPVLDKLVVAPGYETALGAALGEDLTAATDEGAPRHWREAAADQASSGPALPRGAEPLSAHVQGPAVLARRLAQIGVVPDEATGRALAPSLAQGQRLVSREGALWRWDGFTIAAGAPTAAAVRLSQRNRHGELTRELGEANQILAEAEAAFTQARSAERDATTHDDACRQALQGAYRAAAQARQAVTEAQARAAQLDGRLAALDQAAAAADASLAESEQEKAAVGEERAGLPDLGEARARLGEPKTLLAEKRGHLVECRSTAERLRREAEVRRQRLVAIEQERQSWQSRAEAAERQLASLAERREALEAEIEALSRRPAEIAAQRRTLMDSLEVAAAARREAADHLAAAETALTEADHALKRAEADLAAARESRVRAEGTVAQAAEARGSLVERFRERLDCAPEQALAIAELDPGEDLPGREQTETRIQRLIRERENIGPVNLRAETEAAEIDTQLSGLQNERTDLINAIARLRQGISSLNREGRERLLAAFEVVNKNFEELFTRLFGGGRAHLALTENEDPLEAGLEIMASPPGKRLQVLSLLSGGEQALTAIALLFGVFLANPTPICVLDEVDAPLDDANVDRFCTLIEELGHSSATRFLVITHHRMTMARMDRLFGVTMAERGVSQLVSVDLHEADELRATA
ncbi:MAG TPA: chromosome segregation protein SMC [Dongiaceae bacterium]|nr:chromosome segregation protein SMC [Dongiaceae bacterium]